MNAATVTRASKSNLALAFVSLGKEQREAITVFYAFCRLIDDIADSPDLSLPDKAEQLSAWRDWLVRSQAGESPLAAEMRSLIRSHNLSVETLGEIISGVEMDLTISRYATFEELSRYCYRVASAVGLISIEIFGYRNARCRDYAIALGMALQVTNIIRDVGKDLANGGRVYLPLEDLGRLNYSEAELIGESYNDRFVALMDFEAARAWQFFWEADALLPPEDRRTMIAAEIMSSVYRSLLMKMQRDRFRVFEKSYRLSTAAKTSLILAALSRGWLNRLRKKPSHLLSTV